MDPLTPIRRAAAPAAPPVSPATVAATSAAPERQTGPLANGIIAKDTTEQLSRFVQAGRAAKGFKIFDDDPELQSIFVDSIDMGMDSEQSIREMPVKTSTPFLETAFRGC